MPNHRPTLILALIGCSALTGSCSALTDILPFELGPEVLLENAERSGNLGSSERWRGTIRVTGDITVQNGRTLTIEPGTIVTFAPRSDATRGGTGVAHGGPENPHDPVIPHSEISGIHVFRGALIARGTPEQPIVFTSAREQGEYGDWHSIHMHDPAGRVEVTYSRISWAQNGIEVVGGAAADRVVIEHNVFERLIGCGVCFSPNDQPYSVTVKGNTFRYIGHEGVDTHRNANPVIEGNVFEDMRGWLAPEPREFGGNGIIVDHSKPVIRNNLFRRSNGGISCIGPSEGTIMEGNTFGEGADANDDDVTCP